MTKRCFFKQQMNIKKEGLNAMRHLKQRSKDILCGLLLGIIIAVMLMLVRSGFQKRDIKAITANTATNEAKMQEVTFETISKKLENINELSTAEMTYTGIYTTEQGRIPFLTKKGFSMLYTAKVKAGFADISQIDIQIDDDSVEITLPKTEITNIEIDESSVGFYDEKHALFNPDRKSDVIDAISIAKNDLEERVDLSDLITLSAERAKILVKALLEDIVGDKKLTVLTIK